MMPWWISWLPDSTGLIFEARGPADTYSNIYMGGIDGGTPTRITNDVGNHYQPNLSPDGSNIVFLRMLDKDIYTVKIDGTNLTRLTNNQALDHYPVWSPSGMHIAFVSDRDGNEEIYVMASDGSNQLRLTNYSGEDIAPQWIP